MRSGGDVAPFLTYPFVPSVFGDGDGVCLRIEANPCVFGVGVPVDKEVVVAGKDVLVGGKSAGLFKEGFAVGQIASHSHVGQAAEGVAAVLQGGEQGIEADEAVE